MTDAPAPTGPRILMVDDDHEILAPMVRVLSRAGYEVETAFDVPEAASMLAAGEHDVVVTDMGLPSGSGLDVLALAAKRTPPIPVVFVTSNEDVGMAQHTLDQGALRYLTKPIAGDRLLAAVQEAVRAGASVSHRRGLPRSFVDRDVQSLMLARQFDDALGELWLALQPVGSVSTRRAVAYEALVRSRFAPLGSPDRLIGAAEQLGRLGELGRRIREVAAARLAELPEETDLLVNMHPTDFDDESLYDPEAPLSRVASRVVLEITERASLEHVDELQRRIAALRRIGFRIAVDDLGAGYASLSAVAILGPDLVKLDMSLVRNVHTDPVRRRILQGIGDMCRQLGTKWLCEGVETADEMNALVAIGCDLLQGYLLGRPAPAPSPIEAALFDVGAGRRPTRSFRVTVGEIALRMCAETMELCEAGAPPEALRESLQRLRDVLEMLERGPRAGDVSEVA